MVTVSASELQRFLESHDLTDGNAAKVFSVNRLTVKNWLVHGVRGPGAVLIKIMLDQNIPPHWIAQRLGMQLSSVWRHQFNNLRMDRNKAKFVLDVSHQ